MSESHDVWGYGQIKFGGGATPGEGSPDDILFDEAQSGTRPRDFAGAADERWEPPAPVQFVESAAGDRAAPAGASATADTWPGKPDAPAPRRKSRRAAKAASQHPELLTPEDFGHSQAARPKVSAGRPPVGKSKGLARQRTRVVHLLVPAVVLMAATGGTLYLSMVVQNLVMAGLCGALGLVVSGMSWFWMRR